MVMMVMMMMMMMIDGWFYHCRTMHLRLSVDLSDVSPASFVIYQRACLSPTSAMSFARFNGVFTST